MTANQSCNMYECKCLVCVQHIYMTAKKGRQSSQCDQMQQQVKVSSEKFNINQRVRQVNANVKTFQTFCMCKVLNEISTSLTKQALT